MMDFSQVAKHMSSASLFDYAEGEGWKAAIARDELRRRIRRGRVDDMDFDRAAKMFNLA